MKYALFFIIPNCSAPIIPSLTFVWGAEMRITSERGSNQARPSSWTNRTSSQMSPICSLYFGIISTAITCISIARARRATWLPIPPRPTIPMVFPFISKTLSIGTPCHLPWDIFLIWPAIFLVSAKSNPNACSAIQGAKQPFALVIIISLWTISGNR